MTTKWSIRITGVAYNTWRRQYYPLQLACMTVLSLISFALSDFGHSVQVRPQRNDLISLSEISHREQRHAFSQLHAVSTIPITGLAARVAEGSPIPFIGINGGGSGDLGQQVLSLSSQVASAGEATPVVHFGWIEFWEGDWCYGTHAMYNAWVIDSAQWRHGTGGCSVVPTSPTDYLGAHASVGLSYKGTPMAVYAETQKQVHPNATCSTTQDVYGSFLVAGDSLGPCEETSSTAVPLHAQGRDLWPKVAYPYDKFSGLMPGTGDSCTAIHVGTQDIDNGYLLYSRFDPCLQMWSGPILMDSVPLPSHFVLSYPRTHRVIFAFCSPRNRASSNTPDNDLVYYESLDDGRSWISNNIGFPINVTSYAGLDLERAYGDAAGAFTSDGRLHLYWISSFYDSVAGLASDSRCNVRHWSESVAESNGPLGLVSSNIVVRADWVPDGRPGVFNRNICNLSIGIGDGTLLCSSGTDGTNRDFNYLLYTQYGSPDSLDLADTSALGFQNGNLWLSVSPDGGRFWAKAVCITTIDSLGGTPTRSPGCFFAGGPNPCLSERSGTIAERVGGAANIAYDGDLNAGNTPLEWAGSPYGYHMYLRLSADTTNMLCPEKACSDSLSCGEPGDLTQDGVVDVFDVISIIGIAFSNEPSVPRPPGCPMDISDINCDHVVDVFDLISLIEFTFSGGSPLPNPCRCRA